MDESNGMPPPTQVINIKIKCKEQWDRHVYVSLAVLAITVCGIAMSVGGIDAIPKCAHGSPECVFSVQICDDGKLMGDGFGRNGSNICLTVPRSSKVEGDFEQLRLPLASSVGSICPCILLVLAMVIRSVRLRFTCMEMSKICVAFDSIMLINSCMEVDRLTWNCRWWGDHNHSDGPDCRYGFVLYSAGVAVCLAAQFILLVHGVAYTEVERLEAFKSSMGSGFADAGMARPIPPAQEKPPRRDLVSTYPNVAAMQANSPNIVGGRSWDGAQKTQQGAPAEEFSPSPPPLTRSSVGSASPGAGTGGGCGVFSPD